MTHDKETCQNELSRCQNGKPGQPTPCPPCNDESHKRCQNDLNKCRNGKPIAQATPCPPRECQIPGGSNDEKYQECQKNLEYQKELYSDCLNKPISPLDCKIYINPMQIELEYCHKKKQKCDEVKEGVEDNFNKCKEELNECEESCNPNSPTKKQCIRHTASLEHDIRVLKRDLNTTKTDYEESLSTCNSFKGEFEAFRQKIEGDAGRSNTSSLTLIEHLKETFKMEVKYQEIKVSMKKPAS